MLLPFITIFFVSCALLSYEILLIRILGIINWGHYAYMAVSLSMLGLGFSGVLLALGSDFFRRFRSRLILGGCFLFSISVPLCFHLSHRLPVNYLYLIWDGRQFLYLTAQFFLYGIPFLIAATTLALFFTCFKDRTGRVYAFNLAGSGTGVFTALLTMYFLPPESYLPVTGILAAIAGASWGIYVLPRKWRPVTVCFAVLLIPASVLFSPDYLLSHMCEYKGLRGLLRLPGTKIIYRIYSPLGLIHVSEGDYVRLAPGLSLNYTGKLPRQMALTVDGGAPVPVYGFTGSFEESGFLDYTISAAAYSLSGNPSTLIIGAGGGGDVLLAKYHQSRSVKVLEIDPKVIQSVQDITDPPAISPFSLPRVDTIIKEARGYLTNNTGETFDLIFLNPSGSMSTSASGVYAQNEDYLNTVESYSLIYNRLSPNGIFSVSKWLKTPPRDGIKLFATAFTALKNAGVKNPGEHLALIRNWDIITVLIKKTPFTEEEIEMLYNFCNKRSFDVSYLPGMDEKMLNRFHVLPEETYYQAAKSIVSHPDMQEDFFKRYPFYVMPATDDKPYFSSFFRWRAVPHLIRTLRREWLPFAEHGYLTLLATFVQALVFGFLLIILPLAIKLRKSHDVKETGLKTYFCLLGFSYMTLEMALIQKFILFLHHPVYSAGIVIASFLLVSGTGSYISDRFAKKYRLLPFLAILSAGLLYVLFLDKIFSVLGWASIPARLLFSFIIISPLAFFMGMPFPFGIKKAVSEGEKGVGYAWGYNGFFSVAGAVSTPILSSILGFRMVGIIGCMGYLAAMLLWHRVKTSD